MCGLRIDIDKRIGAKGRNYMNKTWHDVQRNLTYCSLYKQKGANACLYCRNQECENQNKSIEDGIKEEPKNEII